MVEGSSGIERLKEEIGDEWQSRVYEIEKGMIRRFVQAIDDPNPLWQVIAPPTFVSAVGFEQIQQQMSQSIPYQTVLHGSSDLEYYQPIRPGDVVTVTTKMTNIRQREGKMGKMAFMTFDATYKNQRQELVARCRQMVIGY